MATEAVTPRREVHSRGGAAPAKGGTEKDAGTMTSNNSEGLQLLYSLKHWCAAPLV